MVQVEPGATLSMVQHFVMTVDADHPEHATSRTTATWHLERPAASVRVQVDTVVTLHDVTVQAAVELDEHPYFQQRWHKQR